MPVKDQKTADAFATSWNNLPQGSVYTYQQFEEWLFPITKDEVKNKTILELGCGNGSLLSHLPAWEPGFITGVDLGASVLSCENNMKLTGFKNYRVEQGDLTTYRGEEQDTVYSIGVLHHLKEPVEGLKAVLNNTKSGGRFHCWVYAKEGNAVIIYFVDPIRKIVSNLPWWFTKYFVALPLVIPYFFYAKIISRSTIFKGLPLFHYSYWIAQRSFPFFHHVAFDQLVTPQTTYISRATIENWLSSFPQIDKNSTYIIFRNGNSWKFGGIKN